ncbi:MAG: enoyl-CoA hydratase family protein [Pseudomonadota bacterium]|jgi:enoyl-CoA hydratase
MPITLEIHDRIAQVIFNHPPVNAFDTAGWELIPQLIDEAGARDDVRCVLIRAEGRGFCGGVDIKEMQAHPERIVQLNRGNFLTAKAVRDCPIPVVSALHGFVIGGGVNIAGASDALLAAEGTYFSLPEIDRGAMGGAAFMLRMFPVHKVRAAFFTGGRVSVDEAHRLGSIEKVVPAAQLLDAAVAFCALIAAKSRTALVLAKQALNGLDATDPLAGYKFEQGFTLEMYLHADSQKARDAFVMEGGQSAKY